MRLRTQWVNHGHDCWGNADGSVHGSLNSMLLGNTQKSPTLGILKKLGELLFSFNAFHTPCLMLC